VDDVAPDRRLLDQLARLGTHPWSGTVWRCTFADNPPGKANVRGARWNPPGLEALYASLERATAIAESDHLIGAQPLRPRARRTVHQLQIELRALIKLTDRSLLAALGVDEAALSADDFRACQAVGGAAAFLHLDGLLVPSARNPGENVVIFFTGGTEPPEVHTLGSEVLDAGPRGR
jgi:RES domain-containing protein